MQIQRILADQEKYENRLKDNINKNKDKFTEEKTENVFTNNYQNPNLRKVTLNDLSDEKQEYKSKKINSMIPESLQKRINQTIENKDKYKIEANDNLKTLEQRVKELENDIKSK